MDLILVPWHHFTDIIRWCLIELSNLTGSGGLAIILFTIIVKVLLLPLTVKSVRSMQSMQLLQPKIKALQKKYGKDRQRLSQETMALYAEHGVSPASGCLPMVAQMPIFFALYYTVRSLSNEHEGGFGKGFLWLQNLGAPDRWELLFFPVVPIALLAGIFQFIQMRMSRPANQEKVRDPQQAMMQGMMNFMPLMVVFFGWRIASGVALYWAVQSLFSVIQQWFITGWGSLKNWAPWLPELPEHRRLGSPKPEKAGKKKKSEPVVVSGEPREMSGIFGWVQRKTSEIEDRQTERARLEAEEEQQRATEPDIVEEPEEVGPDGVITIRASGGQVRRRGRRRRTRGVQGGSEDEAES